MQYNYKPATKLNFTPDVAYLIGVIQGDGTVSKSLDKNGSLSNLAIKVAVGHKDVSYTKLLRNLIFANLKYEPSIKRDPWGYRVSIYNRSLVRALEEFKYKMEVPAFIVENRDLLMSYLQGLFDTDGGCGIDPHSNSASINFSSNKREFIEKVKCILEKEFGIYSSLRAGKKENYKPVYRITITNKTNVLKFIDSVGFRHPRKMKLSGKIVKMYSKVKEKSIRNRGHEKIICLLGKNSEMLTNQIAKELNLHRETVKEHLEKMQNCGIVKKRVIYFNRWGEIKKSHYKRYCWRLNDDKTL